MNGTNGRQSANWDSAKHWLIWGAPVAGCAAALLLWVGGRLAPTVRVSSPAETLQVASAEHVEQLLNSIEPQMETEAPATSPVYATDALLTRVDTNLAP